MDVNLDVRRTPKIFIAFGVCLGGAFVIQSLAVTFISNSLSSLIIIGIVTSAPFILMLIGGGYKLERSGVSVDRYRRILQWSGLGLVLFTIINLALMVGFPVEGFFGMVGWVLWAVTLGAGTGFVIGYFEAIALDREAESQRAAGRNEELEERRQILTYLNGLIRHEVLNTVSIIQGYAELLEESPDDSATVSTYAEIMRREADELGYVTKDVRLLLQAASWEATGERINLSAILTEELRKLQERYETVEIEESIPEEVYIVADNLLPRLFSNLFNNAVEHNDSSNPRVSVALTTSSESVTVCVEDNGPGIPDTKREGLFEPTTSMNTDHGLGLTIVHMLASRYGGSIELAETGPEGSVFTICLPREGAVQCVDSVSPLPR